MKIEMAEINLMDLPSDILKSIFKKSRDLSKEEYELNKNNHNEDFKYCLRELLINKSDKNIAIRGKSIGWDFGGFTIDGGYEGQYTYDDIYDKYENMLYKKYNTYHMDRKMIDCNLIKFEPRIQYLKENHIEVFKKNLLNEICLTDFKEQYDKVMYEIFVSNNRELLINMCASTDEESSSSSEEE